MTRNRVCTTLMVLCLTCLTTLLTAAKAGESAQPDAGLIQVNQHVAYYREAPREPGSAAVNVGLIDTQRGTLVIDAGRGEDASRSVVQLLHNAARPPALLINTHWHLDHIGGNALLRERFQGLQVLAGPGIAHALAHELADYGQYLENRIADGRTLNARGQLHRAILNAPEQLTPDETVRQSHARRIGEREFQVGVEPNAATVADLWVLDPSGVLFAGDLVTLPIPFLDSACPRGWLAAMTRLADVPFTQLVPGHGTAMSRAAFDGYRRRFGELLECANSARSADECAARWLADQAPVPESRRHWQARLSEYVEIDLRADADEMARRCRSIMD